MMNNSWIKLFRKMKDWCWYPDINVRLIFLELLLTVNYEDKEWKDLLIKRGELITSYEHLSKETGISIQQTRTALDKLKLTHEITIKTYNKFTLITINKFNEYQEITSKITNNQQTNNKQITTTKEYKNIRKEDNTIMSGKYLSKWNEVWKTNYTSTKQIDPLISEWLKTYSIDDICSSIERIKFDTYWKDKELDPIWLLRTRDKNGPIDRIGKMLNTDKPALKQVTSLNF